MEPINDNNLTDINYIKCIKVKRKRGRKNKDFINIMNKNEYCLLEVNNVVKCKKRGRKPKIINNTNELKKKRGRKPKVKQFINPSINNSNIDIQFSEKILHLPIKINSSESDTNENIETIEMTVLKYNPCISKIKPYDPLACCQKNIINNLNSSSSSDNDINMNNIININNSENCKNNDTENDNTSNIIDIKNINNINREMNDTLIEFINLDNKNWPLKTNINCWWCKHSFDNRPCFIPEKYLNNVFSVCGCFCSFNCSLAFLINEDIYNKNNKITLLKFMYRMIYRNTNDNIIPSPSWKILKNFGGILDINEYRQNTVNKLIDYNLLFPPIISIIPKVEKYTLNNANTNINTNIIKKTTVNNNTSENVLFIKNKNKNKKNTLESTMGIQIY